MTNDDPEGWTFLLYPETGLIRGSSNKFWQWSHISEIVIEIRIILHTACDHGCCLFMIETSSFYHNLIACYTNM